MVGCALLTGCGDPAPEPPVVQEPEPQVAEQERTVTVVTRAVTVLPHRVGVVVADAAGENLRTVFAEALGRQGVQVAQDARPEQCHVVLVSWCSTRAGEPWGGIPMQQGQFRFALLDARSHDRLGTGVDSASYADPTPGSARQGAIRRAAENAARRVATMLRALPAPEPLAPAPVGEPPKLVSVAALPFHNATARPELNGWCGALCAMAVQDLVASGQYRVVERSRLGDVLKEVDLADMLSSTPANMSDLGQRIGVELLLVGEVAVRPDGALVLTARFVQSSDGQVAQAITASAPPARTSDLEAQFRRQLPRRAMDWISAEIEQLRQAPDAWPTDPR